MANLSTDFCKQIAAERRARGMTQTALAQTVGCKQSAISMLEAGQPTKVSDETATAIATCLGLTMPAAAAVSAVLPPVECKTPGFCPDARCASNIPFTVGDRLLFRPARHVAAPTGGARCAVCGEVLETRCPSCGAVLNDGACCAVCGQAYVVDTIGAADPDAWARTRRADIAAVHSLS